MLKLILLFMFLLAISFACGYAVRDWMSRRRRKEARKKFYKRYGPDAHAPETKTMTGATRGAPRAAEQARDLIAGTTLKIEAFRREAQIEFFATRELLEQKFAEPQHGNNGGRVLAHQTTDQRSPSSD
jgi:hypothetical protein